MNYLISVDSINLLLFHKINSIVLNVHIYIKTFNLEVEFDI